MADAAAALTQCHHIRASLAEATIAGRWEEWEEEGDREREEWVEEADRERGVGRRGRWEERVWDGI